MNLKGNELRFVSSNSTLELKLKLYIELLVRQNNCSTLILNYTPLHYTLCTLSHIVIRVALARGGSQKMGSPKLKDY